MLSISRSNTSRLEQAPEPTDEHDFMLMRDSVFESANFECAETGFRSMKYQHCHHIDGDHSNNDVMNGQCLNPLSHLCKHIGYVGMKNLGTVALCPSFTQPELNMLQIISWVTKYKVNTSNSSAHKDLIQIAQITNQIIKTVKASSIQVERVFGIGDAYQLAKVFERMTDEEYNERALVYGDLRIVFEPSHFSKEIAFWSENGNYFSDFSAPEKWGAIAQNFMDMSNEQ